MVTGRQGPRKDKKKTKYAQESKTRIGRSKGEPHAWLGMNKVLGKVKRKRTETPKKCLKGGQTNKKQMKIQSVGNVEARDRRMEEQKHKTARGIT